MTEFDTMKTNYQHGVALRQPGLSLYPLYTNPAVNEIGGMNLRLYQTDVLTAYPNGSVILRSGGWRTRATLKAINSYLTIGKLTQRKNEWYVDLTNGGTVEFKDGMIINPGRATVDYSGSALQPYEAVEQPAYN